MTYDLITTITGVSGFVGSNLARALLEQDEYKVRVFGVDVMRSDRIEDLLLNDRFSFYDYDVRQPLRSDLLAVDAIYHFAGIADPVRYMREPAIVMDLNILGLRNIIDRIAFWSDHRPRIIFSSTSEVYGLNTHVPFTESESKLVFGPVHKSRWCYAMSKAVCEHYLHAFSTSIDLRYTILRFFNFVGEDVDAPGAGRVITKMVSSALDNGVINVTWPGTQTRCFTYVNDFVEPLMSSLFMKTRDPKAWKHDYTLNLGSTEEITMLDLALRISTLLELMGHSPAAISLRSVEEMFDEGYDDCLRRVPDGREAKRVLGWSADRRLGDFLPAIVRAVSEKHFQERHQAN